MKTFLSELGSDLKVAYIDGDNLLDDLDALQADGEAFTNLDTQENLANSDQKALTANAYLGGWGIKEALDQGADIVICPRVTDAAVVIGPAAWKFNWQRDDYDALAAHWQRDISLNVALSAVAVTMPFLRKFPASATWAIPSQKLKQMAALPSPNIPAPAG